jgi:glutamyl-tRNA(Gln) amidotransferase subunit D
MESIELGSKVRLVVKQHGKEQEYEGTYIESPDKNFVLIKIKTGYNIGFDKKDVLKLDMIEKPKQNEKEKEIAQDKKLPGIALIVTGGTIASKVDYKTGAVSPNPEISALMKNIPGLEKIARINTIEVPFLELSGNMGPEHWKKIAKKTQELLNKPENKGVVILHGTDTLHYTSAALSFMLKDLGKPVVLTYSQRSVDRGSTDAFLNLKCAFHAALSNMAEVMILGHATTDDKFCYALLGSKVRKMHSSRRDTFKAINSEPLARIYENGGIEKITDCKKRDENEKTKLENDFEEKVALIKAYPGASPDILEYYIKKGYKGIVIEGTGFGHVAVEGKNSWLPIIKEACKKMIVCMTTQCIFGRVDSKVYVYGRLLEKAGVLYLNMTSEACYVKLGCMLSREKDVEKVKKMMQKNVAHEFSDRITE